MLNKLLAAIIGEFIVRAMGGFWSIRCRLKARPTSFLIALHDEYLKRRGSYIGHGARFAGEPVFPHGITGINISAGAKIGKDCVIFQQVTIGSNMLVGSGGMGAPAVGDSCYIGAGAKIIGNVTVGNNCRVGANCVVHESMPDNSVAVLGETRVIQKNIVPDNRFFRKSGNAWYYWKSGKWNRAGPGDDPTSE